MNNTQPAQSEEKSPYAVDYKGIRIDPYRILLAYGVTNPAQQHAIKKLLRAGKDHLAWHEDVQEAIDSLKRGLEMHQEDLPTVEQIQAIYKESATQTTRQNAKG